MISSADTICECLFARDDPEAAVLKAVTFDLGDTLIDYGPMEYGPMMAYGVRRVQEYLDTLPGATVPDAARLGKQLRWTLRRVWFRSKFRLDDLDAGEQVLRVLADMGLRLEGPQRREAVRHLFAALERLTRPMPDAAEVLQALEQRGLRLAVISNTVLPGWLLDESLEVVRLIKHFPHRYYSCGLGTKKPHRAIFRHALGELGVEPEAALHVGDRMFTDILGAARSGMRTCLKQSYQSRWLPLVRPDFRIRAMRELVPIVDGLMGA